MVLSEFDAHNNDTNNQWQAHAEGEYLELDDDLLAEEILENMTRTPIGQVLKRIASMPEVRKEKILKVRSQICKGNYELGERLDVALDKVLEELLI